MNIKKLTTLVAVGIVSLLSTFQTPTKTEAALTAPASYDIKFSYWNSGGLSAFRYSRQDDSASIYPRFTRTTDGSYYNYTHTLTGTSSNLLGQGLDITMTFNRSNTVWTAASPSGYYPTDTKIGSDNTVGSVLNKLYIKFNNQTANDFYVSIDISSGGSDTYNFKLNDKGLFTYFSHVYSYDGTLQQLYIPSYSTFEFYTDTTSSEKYFDAWYLQDLGVSDAYQTGYDNGYNIGENDGYQDGLNNNPNILLNGFQAMVGILVNFFLMIVNLEVFGVSIMGIFSIVVLFVGIVWVLKLIRG
jgi:hypothetical protein